MSAIKSLFPLAVLSIASRAQARLHPRPVSQRLPPTRISTTLAAGQPIPAGAHVTAIYATLGSFGRVQVISTYGDGTALVHSHEHTFARYNAAGRHYCRVLIASLSHLTTFVTHELAS